jgi:hypothetical protein
MSIPTVQPKKYLDFSSIIPLLRSPEFEVPINQELDDNYFPTFLEQQLTGYIKNYTDKILPLADGAVRYSDGQENVVLKKITTLSNGILQTVIHYYYGRVLEATETFNKTLDLIKYNAISTAIKIDIKKGTSFYRTRPGDSTPFLKKDLFHNPFEKRHLVKTSRYSIPGYPALYLGSSVYVCWEEYGRPEIKKLHFSRFSNTRDLKISRLQRLDDFIKVLENSQNSEKLKSISLLRYLSFFPLVIACTIRTQKDGIFKPEYIIPQLLLQYISSNDSGIDGIMFPSSKVTYSKTTVPSYNYVFPVRTNQVEGYCSFLMDLFELTEPTSLELEELRNHFRNTEPVDESCTPLGDITIVGGIIGKYSFTALGHLEEILNSRKAHSLIPKSLDTADSFDLEEEGDENQFLI